MKCLICKLINTDNTVTFNYPHVVFLYTLWLLIGQSRGGEFHERQESTKKNKLGKRKCFCKNFAVPLRMSRAVS